MSLQLAFDFLKKRKKRENLPPRPPLPIAGRHKKRIISRRFFSYLSSIQTTTGIKKSSSIVHSTGHSRNTIKKSLKEEKEKRKKEKGAREYSVFQLKTGRNRLAALRLLTSQVIHTLRMGKPSHTLATLEQ